MQHTASLTGSTHPIYCNKSILTVFLHARVRDLSFLINCACWYFVPEIPVFGTEAALFVQNGTPRIKLSLCRILEVSKTNEHTFKIGAFLDHLTCLPHKAPQLSPNILTISNRLLSHMGYSMPPWDLPEQAHKDSWFLFLDLVLSLLWQVAYLFHTCSHLKKREN